LWSESNILSGVRSIYSEANLFDEAETSYRQALKLDPQNPGMMNGLAWFLINNDINVDEGLKLVQEALEFRPANYVYQQTKGWGLYKSGNYMEALDLLEKSWEARPEYDHGHYLLIQEVEKALAKQQSEQ
jgi:Tfp pilus assembly protein PilF